MKPAPIHGGDVILFDTFKIDGLRKRCVRQKCIKWIYYGMPTSHQSIVYRVSVLDMYKFSAKYRMAGDYDNLCLLFAKNVTFHSVNKAVSVFHNDGVSVERFEVSAFEAYESRNERFPFLPKIFNLSILMINIFVKIFKLRRLPRSNFFGDL